METDEVLAAKVKRGDETAFATLLDRYSPKLTRYGRRFLRDPQDVDEAVQDAFIAAYRNFQSYDLGQRFSPWMYRIAHNTFIDILRRKKREPIPFDLDVLAPHLTYDDPMPREKENAELRVVLERGLLKLSPAYREVIDLYYFEEMSYRDIADIMHVPVGTVAIRLSRAKASLKKLVPSAKEFL